MPVMRFVWPITALYMGPIALVAYMKMGRRRRDDTAGAVFKATTHCGAGCTLGDIVAESFIFLTGITVAGRAIWAEYPADFVCAFVLGIAFQYFTIAPMRGLGFRDGLIAAMKADTLSLTAFEVGLFAWMGLMAFVFFDPPLRPNDLAYWGLMQFGMVIGFVTSYPMNWWLVARGIKERM